MVDFCFAATDSQNVWESVPFLAVSISLSLWESKIGIWSISVLLLQIAKMYGKVFHFWQFDKGDTLPISPPHLMMAITADGQLKLAAGE